MENKLITSYNKLIWYIANKFYGVDRNDLYQTGVKALLEAYQRFDNSKNAKFSSYAYSYIYGEMYKLANNHLLKVNRDLLKLKKSIEKARDLLTQKNGYVPTINDLANFLGYNIWDIKEALACLNPIYSMDEENPEMRNLYESVADPHSIDIDQKLLIDDCLDNLNPLEQEIIKSRYYEDLTQQETADRLGLSQVKVSRSEARILTKMRDYINL